MKELKVCCKNSKDFFSFELAEKNDGIVPVKSNAFQVPENFVLYSINGSLVYEQGMTLQHVNGMANAPENYPLSLLFRCPQSISTSKHKLKLPVPDDFFGKIPPLTSEEVGNYQELAKSWVKGLLDASTATEGFHHIASKDNVDIYSGLRPGSRVVLIRGQTRMKSTRAELRAFMISPTTESFRRLFHMIDVQFQDGLMLHQFPAGYKHPDVPFYSIKWAIMGAPGPVWFRDVCWLEYGDITTDENGQEIGFGVGGSIERPECPTLEHLKLIRAEILCTGYVFRDAGIPGFIDVTYVIQADPKGWLPVWLINMFAGHQGMNVARIRDVAEGINQALVRMSDHKRHGASVQGVLVAHSKQHTIDVTVTESDSILHFGFCTASHDIGFRIAGLSTSHKWSMPNRYSTGGKPLSGKVNVDVGRYHLQFDNTYSWFRAKQVYYWYHVSSAADPDKQMQQQLK